MVDIVLWVKDNPGFALVIGAGVVLVLYWLNNKRKERRATAGQEKRDGQPPRFATMPKQNPGPVLPEIPRPAQPVSEPATPPVERHYDDSEGAFLRRELEMLRPSTTTLKQKLDENMREQADLQNQAVALKEEERKLRERVRNSTERIKDYEQRLSSL